MARKKRASSSNLVTKGLERFDKWLGLAIKIIRKIKTLVIEIVSLVITVSIIVQSYGYPIYEWLKPWLEAFISYIS